MIFYHLEIVGINQNCMEGGGGGRRPRRVSSHKLKLPHQTTTDLFFEVHKYFYPRFGKLYILGHFCYGML